MSTVNINQQCLNQAKAFMLDMDGTFFLGEHLLPGGLELLDLLNQRCLPFSFLTNNTSRAKEAYEQKLARLGVSSADARVYTAGEATISYLHRNFPGRKVFLLGTEDLAESFRAGGIRLCDGDPEVVVIGYDTSLTYARLSAFCGFVRQGLPYIATHPDVNCPMPGGPVPDIGSIMSLVKASTGREADQVLGKPNPGIVSELAAAWGVQPSDMVMVGDRLYTDIALGQTAGVRTVLVLSGETRLVDLDSSPYQPDIVVQNLSELVRLIRASE